MNRILRVVCAVGGTWWVACSDSGTTGSAATHADATSADSAANDSTAVTSETVTQADTAVTTSETVTPSDTTATTPTDTTATTPSDTTATTPTDTTRGDTTPTDTQPATDTVASEVGPNDPVVDLRADGNRDGVVDFATDDDDDQEETWSATHGAIFLANLDDDQKVCPANASDVNYPKCMDAGDDKVNGDADLTDLAPLRVAPGIHIPDGAMARLTASSPGGNYVRVFQQSSGTGAHAADWNSVALGVDTWDATRLRAGIELRVEGKDIVRDTSVWDGYVDLTLQVRDMSAKVIASDTVRMRVSPVMLFHHLLPAETFYVTAIDDPDSVDFRNDLQAAIDTLSGVPLRTFAVDDPWTQDFFETGYMSMPAAGGGQKVIHVNFRSANIYNFSQTNPLRDAGDVVYSELRGEDSAGITQFDPNHDPNMDSLNSFGNTETLPPFTHDGATWPLGRIVRGSITDFYPDPKFSKMLESQGEQTPVYIDTSWLLVGHVDETLSFVRAPTPQGWTIVVNDPALAISTLQGLVTSGHGSTPMFVGRKWLNNNGFEYSAQTTISAVLADQDVMEETTKAIASVSSQLDILLAATGIAPEDVIHIPYTHWSVDGYSVAYQPGTVNFLYVSDDTVAAADPHGPIVDGVDVFKAQMEAEFDKIGMSVMWVEDWNLYHRNLGEVHCGTNTTRQIPAAKWWESGR